MNTAPKPASFFDTVAKPLISAAHGIAPSRRVGPNELTATTSFEIEVELTGTFVRGCPERGPTYSCGGTPAEPDMVEDIDIADIGMIISVRHAAFGRAVLDWKTASILEGVDRNSEAYQQIVANILKLIGDEAEEALMAEAGE